MFDNPICVALDTPDAGKAAATCASALRGSVGMVKVGMEQFYAQGRDGYARVAAAGVPVFLDLKLHDIPNTVAQGLTSLMNLSPAPAIVNVHASGGPAMLEAAARAVDGRARLIAVTILTSLSDDDIHAAGYDPAAGTAQMAVKMAELSKACGLDGVVCSPHDIAAIKQACGSGFLTIVPGVRPAGADVQDQKRIATPEAARAAGADVLVIGRPDHPGQRSGSSSGGHCCKSSERRDDDSRCVKICGLSEPAHVRTAVEAGAEYVGFVFLRARARATCPLPLHRRWPLKRAAGQRSLPWWSMPMTR